MKKIVCWCLMLALCLPLCACGSTPSETEMNRFLHRLSLAGSMAGNADANRRMLEKWEKTEEFSELLNRYLTERIRRRDFDSAFRLIYRLKMLRYAPGKLSEIPGGGCQESWYPGVGG